MTPPLIIILNGVSSVGKTSTSLALQAVASRPFLHVAMDAFIGMLPRSMFGHPEGLMFETVEAEGGPAIVIRAGEVLERAMRGMRHSILAMAAQGNELIVDEVMIGPDKVDEYRALLKAFNVRFVGLFASLDVLEERERQRGDRRIGLARWQFARVHQDITYDLQIDTTTGTPAENAQTIRTAFGL